MSLEDNSYVIITGPNGAKHRVKPSEARGSLEKLNVKRRNAEKLAIDAAVKAEADEALLITKERTAEGLDYQRKPFGQYSPRYAVEKGSSKVDLKHEGEMLESLSVVKLANGRYRLAFGNSFRAQVKGLATGRWPLFGNRAHMTNNPRPKRRAMGTESKQDIARLAKEGYRAFQRVMRKELKR